MSNYVLPDLPVTYYLKVLRCECRKCKNIFEVLLPFEDLVKFIEIDGSEVRWLPTYGRGGFNSIFPKVLMEECSNEIHSMKYVKEFDRLLQDYTEKSINGNAFTMILKKIMCSNCHSTVIRELNETIIQSPQITWMKISKQLME